MLELHFILIAGLTSAVNSVVILLAGLPTGVPLPAAVAQFTSRHEIMQATGTGGCWQDYRLLAAILTALKVWLVAAFWLQDVAGAGPV